ncbi:alcohol dehydrogenase family protein [Vibrio mediterranei]|uniref:Alcohol dehydrogenase n=1 Tax=Vibrio mediterranei TaxID=689 RepID=A0AAN1FJH9_9VIBR|nr:alcohol dehydrogenase family protein [Vibrio mediterranei]ASI91700.1 alcohol dehydrogenase [Vibrio mediterranei]
MSSIMTGVQLIGHGDLEQLVVKSDIVVPKPAANEVLIKVSAAGVNNTDINTRIGWYSKGDNDSEDAGWSGNALSLPRIQGADVCGHIIAVGEHIDDARIGERVLIDPCLRYANGERLDHFWYFGSECDGGFAEFTVVDSRQAYSVNSSYSDIELASFPCSYSTAENMLTRASVTANDTVLVTGASGGVGSAAVQLAKARGAKVIAVTSESKASTLLDIGADKTVSRGESLVDALGKNSVSVVVDLVAGPQWPELLDVMQPKGRYAVSGAIGGAMVELDVRTLYLKDLSFFGCTGLEDEVFPNLISRIEHSQIKPLVGKVFALSDIKQAQQEFVEKSHIGKIVLQVTQG